MTIAHETMPTLVAIRAAHHPETSPAYDRVVFEFSGGMPCLQIQYVKQLIADGSGSPIAIAGRSIVLVHLTPAYAHSSDGNPTAPNRIRPKLPLVREVVSAGDFEAVVTYGIGVSRKAEMRFSTLANPDRLVIDFLM